MRYPSSFIQCGENHPSDRWAKVSRGEKDARRDGGITSGLRLLPSDIATEAPGLPIAAARYERRRDGNDGRGAQGVWAQAAAGRDAPGMGMGTSHGTYGRLTLPAGLASRAASDTASVRYPGCVDVWIHRVSPCDCVCRESRPGFLREVFRGPGDVAREKETLSGLKASNLKWLESTPLSSR